MGVIMGENGDNCDVPRRRRASQAGIPMATRSPESPASRRKMSFSRVRPQRVGLTCGRQQSKPPWANSKTAGIAKRAAATTRVRAQEPDRFKPFLGGSGRAR